MRRFACTFLSLLLWLSLSPAPASAERATGERPFYCDPTDLAPNDGHGEHFHHLYGEKGPLSRADCQALSAMLSEAESFAVRYPTVADAEAAGWTAIAAYVEGQGVHFEAPRDQRRGFDPGRPGYLLYDGVRPDARLAGMMYLVRADHPPEGFPGANDHWHNHPELCFDRARTFVLGEHLSPAQCAVRDGILVDTSDMWMVHVWLPVYDGWQPDDIFARSHPSL